MGAKRYAYEVGTRVNCAGNFPYTPGTVSRILPGFNEPAYRVKWDDGFIEDADVPDANVWFESGLEPFEVQS